jgi:acyl-CoA dehydrogenase
MRIPATRQYPTFFEEEHAALADKAMECAVNQIVPMEDDSVDSDEDTLALAFAEILGASGLAAYCVPEAYGGARKNVDCRSLCLIREALGWSSGFADSLLALQGLGSYPITLAGTEDQKSHWLPSVARAHTLCAFALTEENAGSDVGAMETAAQRHGNEYVLNGSKRFITNAGIAGTYIVFAKTDHQAGNRGISAFIVTPDDEGFRVAERQRVIAPHPIGTLSFEECRIPAKRLLGKEGDGFKIAMTTLDRFRPTVGAAAIGMGHRALEEALNHTLSRKQFGKPLFGLQAVQMQIAQAATDLEASRMLVLQAAWNADRGAGRISLESAMAKLAATEAAFRAVDSSVQLHGGSGVLVGGVPERLYREVRALRIYEGASDVQRIVIARHLQKLHEG